MQGSLAALRREASLAAQRAAHSAGAARQQQSVLKARRRGLHSDITAATGSHALLCDSACAAIDDEATAQGLAAAARPPTKSCF